MSEKQTIIERIKKLLALGGSSNVHEAATAAAMASRLMSEHKLSEMDMTEDVGDPEGIFELPMGAEGFMAPWRFVLVSMTARAFFCDAISLRIKNRRKIRIVGKKQDAETASVVYKILAREIDRLADEEVKDPYVEKVMLRFRGMDVRSYKENFRKGAAAAISDRLKEEVKNFARQSDKALVLARASKGEIRDYLENRYGKPNTVTTEDVNLAPQGGLTEEEAVWRGYAKGSDVKIPGRQEEEQKKLQATSRKREAGEKQEGKAS